MANTTRSALVQLSDADMTIADTSIDVRGRRVLDKLGDELGNVDGLLMDQQEQKVRFLQVAAGGFLGIGERHFLIPVDAVTNVDSEHVHVDQTRERVVGAPAYDPNVVPEATYYDDLYGYYGYGSYWGPGYVYPAYPYYGRGMY